jgi:hypothetical protein
MPQGGLRQFMLHPEVALQPGDLVNSNDILHGSVWEQISTFVIAEAIRRVYPEATEKIFKDSEDKYPYLSWMSCKTLGANTLHWAQYDTGE